MELRPSEIFYTQDSIMNRFGDYTDHGNTCIGETLDQLLRGYCNVRSIPMISVVKRDGKWFTCDNRRLWVFRKAEELGFLDKIEVNETFYINEDKFTTENGGTSIRVRGRSPGGSLWRTWKPKRRIPDPVILPKTSYNIRRDIVSPRQTSTTNVNYASPVSTPTRYIQSTSATFKTPSPIDNHSFTTYNQPRHTANQTIESSIDRIQRTNYSSPYTANRSPETPSFQYMAPETSFHQVRSPVTSSYQYRPSGTPFNPYQTSTTNSHQNDTSERDVHINICDSEYEDSRRQNGCCCCTIL